MASEGPNSAGSGTDDASTGTVAWTNTGNVTASDNVYATAALAADEVSHFLLAKAFGFSSVSGSVDGILVEVECSVLGNAVDNNVKLFSGGVFVGTNKAAATSIPSPVDAYLSYGGAADTWLASLAAGDVTSSGFGVGFAVKESLSFGATVSVDHVRITVTYSAFAAANVPRMDLHGPHLFQRRLDVQAYRWEGREGTELIGILPDGRLRWRQTRYATRFINAKGETGSWECASTASPAPTPARPPRRGRASRAGPRSARSFTTC